MAVMISSSFALSNTSNSNFDQNPKAKKPDPKEMVNKTMDALGKKLPMSPAKTKKIKAILLDFHKQIPETMKKGEGKMAALEDKTNGKVKALLTNKEYQIYLETMKTLKPNGPPRGLKMK